MIITELPSDLSNYRHTPYGWFRRERICGDGAEVATTNGADSVRSVNADGSQSVSNLALAGLKYPVSECTVPVAAISGKGRWDR